MVDPDPILGTLDARWEYTLDASYPHTHTQKRKKPKKKQQRGIFSLDNPPNAMVSS